MPWIPQHDLVAVVAFALSRAAPTDVATARSMCIHWDCEPDDTGIFAYAHKDLCHHWTSDP